MRLRKNEQKILKLLFLVYPRALSYGKIKKALGIKITNELERLSNKGLIDVICDGNGRIFYKLSSSARESILEKKIKLKVRI